MVSRKIKLLNLRPCVKVSSSGIACFPSFLKLALVPKMSVFLDHHVFVFVIFMQFLHFPMIMNVLNHHYLGLFDISYTISSWCCKFFKAFLSRMISKISYFSVVFFFSSIRLDITSVKLLYLDKVGEDTIHLGKFSVSCFCSRCIFFFCWVQNLNFFVNHFMPMI